MKTRNRLQRHLGPALLLLIVGALLFIVFGEFAVSQQASVVSQTGSRAAERRVTPCQGVEPIGDPAGMKTPAIDRDPFTVLSWNTHKGKDQRWFDDFIKLAVPADILLLQEAVLSNDLQGRLTEMNRTWLLAPAFSLGSEDIGVMSASPANPVGFCAVRGEEPLIRIPKMALAGTYRIAGSDQTLLVVNVHLVNFTLSLDSVRRQLAAITDIVRAHRGPVIVAGDFNTWNDERSTLVRSEMAEVYLQPVFFSPDERTRFFNHPVDAVYYRGLHVLDAHISTVNSSDHNPLQVRFSISG